MVYIFYFHKFHYVLHRSLVYKTKPLWFLVLNNMFIHTRDRLELFIGANQLQYKRLKWENNIIFLIKFGDILSFFLWNLVCVNTDTSFPSWKTTWITQVKKQKVKNTMHVRKDLFMLLFIEDYRKTHVLILLSCMRVFTAWTHLHVFTRKTSTD